MNKFQNRFRTSLLLTSLLTASVWAAAARAADTAPQGGIEEVTVTARKRVETVQDVPSGVTAMAAAQIKKFDIFNLESVAARTPALEIGRAPSGAGATLVMRGIGSNSTSIGIEQSVAVIVDGVYYGQGRTIDEGLIDLGRIEILKGPQALFQGKNATAGAISITTADPTDKREFMARFGYEAEGRQYIGEAMASGPISDTLGIRLAFRGSGLEGGYFRNIGATQDYQTRDRTSTAQVVTPVDHYSGVGGNGAGDEYFFRGTLKWRPSQNLTATLKASLAENNNDNPGASSVLYYCPSGHSASNPAIPCGHSFQSSSNLFPADIAASVPYANPGGALGDEYKSGSVTGTVNYDLKNISLTSVTNYNVNRNIFQFDADSVSASGPVGVFATEATEYHAFSTEERALTRLHGPINAMLGVYYQHSHRDYLAFTASGGLANSLAPNPYQLYLANSKNSQTSGDTISLFGQGILKPTSQIEITGGVRYTHETKDSFFFEPYSHPIRVTQGVFRPNTVVTANQVFSNWSPEATISYKPTRDVNIYAAYKTGYKSGGFSNSGILSAGNSVNDFAFLPETVNGFEGGVKSMLFDRQLRLNVTAFDYRYKNLQVDFFNSPVFAFSTINAGSASTKGVEVDFEYAPREVAGLNLHGGVNYDRAVYGDDPNAPCYTGMTIAQGCTIPTIGARPTQNLKGNPTANSPSWTGTLGFDYGHSVGHGLNADIAFDARYSDSYLASAFGNPATRQDSYVSVDAALHVRTENERWEFAVIGKNLTNAFYAVGGTDAPNTGSGTGTANGHLADQIGFVGLPRTIELQVTFRY